MSRKAKKQKKLDKPEYHYQNLKIKDERSFSDGKKVHVISYLNPNECIVTMDSEEGETILLKQEDPKFDYILMDGRNKDEIIAICKRAECLFYIYLINRDKGVVKTIRTALFADYYNSKIELMDNGCLQITSNTMSADCIVSVDLTTGISNLLLYEPSNLSWSDMRRDVLNDTKTKDYYSYGNSFISIDEENQKIKYNFNGDVVDEELKLALASDFKYIEIQDKKFVLLSNEYFCFLLNENEDLIFHGNSFHSMSEELYSSKLDFSSDIKEDQQMSSITNLEQIGRESNWIFLKSESLDEKIQIKASSEISSIILFNGFLSYKAPNLYKEYSRVKTIEIVNNDTKETVTVGLKDIPDPQYIPICSGENFTLIIKDVYSGDKKESVCINSIIGIKEEYNLFI